MAKNSSTPSGQYIIIWIGLLVGLGFYIADILIDVFVFHSGTLMEEIIRPTYHEVWMRSTVLLVAVAFAIYVRRLLRREQKLGERAMTAEKFLNTVIDNIPSMIFIKNAEELRFIRINHTGEQLLGLTTQQLIGKNDYDFFPESQAEFFTRKDREVLESGIRAEIPEEQIDSVSLGKRWLSTRKVPILDDTGRPIYLLGISEDITEARQVASDLRETEVRYQTLFNSAADFIFVVDPEGRVIEANRYACEHSGYKKQEIIGHNIKKLFTRMSQETCDCNFPGLKKRGYNRADIEFVCKDGRVLQMECLATAVPDENGHFSSFLIIQRDVTSKKQAEAEMRHHQQEIAHVMRLSTMGEMASGMAHEINQPLAALTSYCGTAISLAKSTPAVPQELCDILERASAQAHRAGEIIRHLRAFVRQGNGHKQPLDIDQVIDGINVLLSSELKSANIKLECHLGSQGRKVNANKVQIEQVIINLIMNGIEAIRCIQANDGKILVETHVSNNESIEVTVIDNGPGLDAGIIKTMFNPFQTTKASGMGMGLSISQSIIAAHGGRLWADEQRDNGALLGFSLSVCE